MVVKYTDRQAAKVVLAGKESVLTLEQQYINKLKYDKPCSTLPESQHIGLFLLFSVANLTLFEDETQKNTVLTKLNRWASNYILPSSFSDNDADVFLVTEEGQTLINSL